mmetsp:Transcript_20734/g.57623  ORF Transcript_20734/g.57623 Transcript_20734/m.57623 type:complete len:83 (+) Transcript_20734:195-443(+)
MAQSWLMRVLGFGPYFRSRSGSFEGIFVASVVGVVSGYYIFDPLLREIAANRKEREAIEQASANNSTRTNSSTPKPAGGDTK